MQNWCVILFLALSCFAKDPKLTEVAKLKNEIAIAKSEAAYWKAIVAQTRVNLQACQIIPKLNNDVIIAQEEYRKVSCKINQIVQEQSNSPLAIELVCVDKK